jgi:hypothetical protein
MAQEHRREGLPVAMIKLVSAETNDARHLLLRFSDGAWGVLDFGRYIDAATEVTRRLQIRSFSRVTSKRVRLNGRMGLI